MTKPDSFSTTMLMDGLLRIRFAILLVPKTSLIFCGIHFRPKSPRRKLLSFCCREFGVGWTKELVFMLSEYRFHVKYARRRISIAALMNSSSSNVLGLLEVFGCQTRPIASMKALTVRICRKVQPESTQRRLLQRFFERIIQEILQNRTHRNHQLMRSLDLELCSTSIIRDSWAEITQMVLSAACFVERNVI